MWERGNIASCGNIMPITVRNNPNGTLDNDEVEFHCKLDDSHIVKNRVLSLESSHNECNG